MNLKRLQIEFDGAQHPAAEQSDVADDTGSVVSFWFLDDFGDFRRVRPYVWVWMGGGVEGCMGRGSKRMESGGSGGS